MLVPDHYSVTWQFVLPDSLRILCCCGDAGLTHVDRSTKAFGSSLSFDLSSSSQSLSSALTSSLTLSHGGLVSPYGGTGGGVSSASASDAIASTWSDQLREIRYDHFSKQYGIEAVKQFDMLSGQHV